MKKIISLFLALFMVFSLSAPAFAEGEAVALPSPNGSGTIPVISIYGDGAPIVDENQKTVFHFSKMLDMLGGTEDGALGEATVNILMPFLMEGIINDEWDSYYDALEEEIGELFTEARLDKNGEVWNNTGITEVEKDVMLAPLNKTYTENSKFGNTSFIFKYDWRLDPVVNADNLNEYIKAVKKATGRERVGVSARCLGNNVLNAYVSKYGTEDLTGVGFAASMVNGAEIISEPLSGKFTLDGNAIARFIKDLEDLGHLELDSFITKSISMLENTGALDGIIGVTKEYIYYKVVEGVTSALALSTFFTWPAYWSCVSDEDLPEALNYVFGPEGSEKREEYAGLIDKIENYGSVVRDKRDEINDTIDEEINVCVIVKYGRQIAPICKSYDAIADQFVSVEKASYGATTGTVYKTLSEEYIFDKMVTNEDKYISPDKQIDASTCRFRDNTWFFKGVSHSDYTGLEENLMYDVVTSPTQHTVDDFKESQFVAYKLNKDNQVDQDWYHGNFFYTWEKMTVDNCNTEPWDANEKLENPKTEEDRYVVLILTLLDWLIDFLQHGPIWDFLINLGK